jgi:potassium channel subfamily K
LLQTDLISRLTGINAAQLAIALISNLFLLLDMARRVRFSIAQPITIIGWFLSSFALMGLCACASGPLIIEPRCNHAFTQAFYYAIFSAGLYFLVAALMLITVWGFLQGALRQRISAHNEPTHAHVANH